MTSPLAPSSTPAPGSAAAAADECEFVGAVRELVDAYRARCLWFLRPDYYPTEPDEIRQVLGYIERGGDVVAHRRAATLRAWLSRLSSAASAG